LKKLKNKQYEYSTSFTLESVAKEAKEDERKLKAITKQLKSIETDLSIEIERDKKAGLYEENNPKYANRIVKIDELKMILELMIVQDIFGDSDIEEIIVNKK
jgi:hypothetical protein